MKETNASALKPRPKRSRAEPPRKVLSLILVGGDHGYLDGLTSKDQGVKEQLCASTGDTPLQRLIGGAKAQGYAVLIRSDLPSIE